MKKAFDTTVRFCAHLLFVLATGAFLAACGGGGGGAGFVFDPTTTPSTQNPPPAVTEYSQEVRYEERVTVRIQGGTPGQTRGAAIGLLNVGGGAPTEVILDMRSVITLNFDENGGIAVSLLTLSAELPRNWLGATVILSRNNELITVTLQSNVLERVAPVSIAVAAENEDTPEIEINFLGNSGAAATTEERTVTVVTATLTTSVTVKATNFVVQIEEDREITTLTLTTDVTHHTTTLETVYEYQDASTTQTMTTDVTLYTTTVETATREVSVATATLVTATITTSTDVTEYENTLYLTLNLDRFSAPLEYLVSNVALVTVAGTGGNAAGTSDYQYFVNGSWVLPTEWLNKQLNPLAIIYLPAVEITAPKPVVISNIVTTTTETVTEEVTVVVENTVVVTQTVTEYKYESVEQTVATVVMTNQRTVTITTGGVETETVVQTVATVVQTQTITMERTVSYVLHTTAIEEVGSGVTTTKKWLIQHKNVVLRDGVEYIHRFYPIGTPSSEVYPVAIGEEYSTSITVHSDFGIRRVLGGFARGRYVYHLPGTLYVDDSGYQRPLSVILPPASTRKTLESFDTTEYRGNYGLGAINAENAHARYYLGASVTVAVIDTGVHRTHEELSYNVVEAVRVSTGGGSAFITTTDIADPNGHGSGVAGVIAGAIDLSVRFRCVHYPGDLSPACSLARSNVPLNSTSAFHGVAPSAKLLPIQLSGDGTYPLPHVLKALEYVAEKNVPIVNNSYGDSIDNVTVRYMASGNMVTGTVSLPASPDLSPIFGGRLTTFYPGVFGAIEEVTRNKDMVMVWAAGNDGWNSETGRVSVRSSTGNTLMVAPEFLISNAEIVKDGDVYTMSTLNLKADQVGVMGLAPLYEEALFGKWVVAVATDSNNTIAGFSEACGRAKYWCVAAPGVNITSATNTDDGHKAWDGTSFAAAHVSGALAVLKSRFPGMPMNAVLAILLKTATDLGERGVDEVYGHGLINLGKAITMQGVMNLAISGANAAAGALASSNFTPPPPTFTRAKSGTIVSLAKPNAANAVDYDTAEYRRNWGLNFIRASVAYGHGYFGQGVTVAVLDTGIQMTHEGLRANIVPGARVAVDGSGKVTMVTSGIVDNNGRGTGLAGIIAGVKDGVGTHGVAPQAKIMPVKILDSRQYVLRTPTIIANNAHVRGMAYALDRGAPIINNSHDYSTDLTIVYDNVRRKISGAPVVPKFLTLASNRKLAENEHFIRMSLMNDEIADNDAVMVWSAGNSHWHSDSWFNVEGLDGVYSFYDSIRARDLILSGTIVIDNNQYQSSTLDLEENQPQIMALAPLYYPDLLGKWVVVAGMIDFRHQDHYQLNYSNGCGKAKHWCLTAPGSSISTAISDAGNSGAFKHGSRNNHYSYWTGSSSAAPHVSGALAVLRSRFPAMPMNAVLAILLKTATDLGVHGVDDVYGHGLLNLGAAITVQGDMDLVLTAPVVAQSVSSAYDTAEYRRSNVLGRMNALVAYDKGYFGQSVTVAVVDSGVWTTHKDLSANIVPGARVTVDGSGSVTVVTTGITDPDGHGTGVAGVIAAAAGNGLGIHGVAPQAKIMPVQISGLKRPSQYSPLHSSLNLDVEAGIAHALDNSVHIIHSSYNPSILDATVRIVGRVFSGGQINDVLTTTTFDLLPISPEIFSLYVTPNDAENPYLNQMRRIKDEIVDNDAVMVVPAGDGGWNSERGMFRRGYFMDNLIPVSEFVVSGTLHKLSELNLQIDQPQIMALAPMYHEELKGKWVVAVETEWVIYGENISDTSNGCGRAMHWCVAAPHGHTIVPTSDTDPHRTRTPSPADDDYQNTSRSGTAFSAAYVSGALAVLKSRFTGMPMSAILAILFDTATDMGLPGVDPVYGHGRINLGAAINEQDDSLLIKAEKVAGSEAKSLTSSVGGSTRAMDFSDTQLAPGTGALARQLSGLPIAVSYLYGQYYFDTPLSKISDFEISEEFSLGNAAADMFDTPQRAGGDTGAMAIMDTQNGKIHRAGYAGEEWRLEYDICTDCERESWYMDRAEGIGNAYFGENQQGLGASWSPWSADSGELEVFSAVGLGEDGEEESYRQYGARWYETLSSFSLMAELSEIQEDGSMLGNRGDVFGFTASNSRQARLALSGELGGWQWQGGYLHGWTDTGLNGRGLVSDISDITYSQWHLEGMAKSLLRGDDEFRLGVSGMPQVRGEMRVNYLRASNEKFIDEFQFSLPTGVKAESMVLRNLSDKSLVWRMGYKWRPLPTHKGMQAALGVETVSGGGSDGDTAASFQLRWDF